MPLDIPVINDPKQTTNTVSSYDVTTDDSQVRTQLQRLGHPETLSNESSLQRRERLIKALQNAQTLPEEDNEMSDESMESSDDEEFYTPGSEELLEARKHILEMSVAKASSRIKHQQSAAMSYNSAKTLRHRRNINKYLGNLELNGTFTFKDNTRALSAVRCNKDSTRVACGSWDGRFYVMDTTQKNELQHFCLLGYGHHTEKVSALDWSPSDTLTIITGGAEGTLNMWNAREPGTLKPTLSFKDAHEGRVTSAKFHPSGQYAASASFDQTWKLWDVEKQKEILEQEGHDKEVFTCSFHPDGSLIASGGLDSVARVWDLRSGRSIAIMRNHVKGIYSMDWSPNGHHFATAGGDGAIKIWDMRKITSANDDAELYSIPAHTKLVSDVRFYQGTQESQHFPEVADEDDQNPSRLDACGSFLVSSSYDGTVKLWSADNWVCCKLLQGHNDKVMSCDVNQDALFVVSCGWDRNLRMWC